MSGPCNFHAVAHCRDLDELFEFTTDRMGSLAGLQSMEVSPVLQHVTQTGTLLPVIASSTHRTCEPDRERLPNSRCAGLPQQKPQADAPGR
ncbi:hypothetical protein ABZT04_40580 [Streptomyces sp. NPDC005492]|uniref:hypothetical protein n=1 Tax=Streptomyces sp. NPDC005492 TaxID=3156883 RepID=UPI0033B2EBCB